MLFRALRYAHISEKFTYIQRWNDTYFKFFLCFCAENCEEPTITKCPARVVHQLGSGDIKLRCKATGDPKPTISWSPIRSKTRFTDKGEGVLTIRKPVAQDAGIYSCIASNECGRSVKNTTLVIVKINDPAQINNKVKIPCLRFPPIEGVAEVEYDGDLSPRTIARFFCEVEHELFGPTLTECLDNGEWNESAPECLPFRQCSQPKNPPHGKVLYRKPVYQPGDRATFECKKGFTNVGSSYRVCEENLQWSKAKPDCVKNKKNSRKSCGNPGEIVNGFKITSHKDYRIGSSVTYKCSQGYFISGASHIICLSTGLWSAAPPTCEMVMEDVDVLANNFAEEIDHPDPESSGDPLEDCCIDLIFVLDKSGSVSNSEFRISLDFVKETVCAYTEICADVRFSLVTYNKHAEILYNYTSVDILNCKYAVRDARRGSKTYGPTATRRGLDTVRDHFLINNRHGYDCTPPTERPEDKDFFSYPCPTCSIGRGLNPNCSTLLFLVTDGRSNWAGDPRNAAECLKSNGVKIFSVGVTSGVNLAELRDIASEPLSSHLYLLKSFDDALKLVFLAKKRFN